MTTFITEATQHFLPKITSISLIPTLQVILIHDCPRAIYRTVISILRKSTGFAIKLTVTSSNKAGICVLQQEGKIPSGGARPVVWFGTIALFFFTGSKIQQKKLIKSLLREKRTKGKKEVSLYRQPHAAPSHQKRDGEF